LLNDRDRPVQTIAAIRASVTVGPWGAVGSCPVAIRSAVPTWSKAPAYAGGSSETAATALCITVNCAACNVLGHNGDVSAIAARPTSAAVTAARSITALASARARIVVSVLAASAADTTGAAGAAGATITTFATAAVYVHSHNKVINLERYVAAEFPKRAVIATRTWLAIAAPRAGSWWVVSVPVIHAVDALLAGLSLLTGRSRVAVRAVGALPDNVRHNYLPTI
jgi:hypothetical protein